MEIVPKEGQRISLDDYAFTDENEREVTLGTFRREGVPIALIPVYYGCPSICTVTLNEFFGMLRKSGYRPGVNLEVVVYSINPHDDAETARLKKRAYLKQFQLPESGIHFLVGTEREIAALSDDLGFKFEKRDGLYDHPSAVYLISPGEVIAKVFKGPLRNVKFFRNLVWQTAGGKPISSFENMLRTCSNYVKRLTGGADSGE